MFTEQQRAHKIQSFEKKLDGISNTVLAKSLKELEGDGLVVRREYMEVPIRVEYETTETCDRLVPILEQLSDWCEEYELRGRDKGGCGCGMICGKFP